MKKTVIIGAILVLSSVISFAQKGMEYMQMTTIESVVPGGAGRSRLILTDPSGKAQEIKMENFFSLVGINFENIEYNDITVAKKLTELSTAGWEVVQVSSGAYSPASERESAGIFITRYLLKRPKA